MRAGITNVGVRYAEPILVFWLITEFWLNMLNRSTMALSLLGPIGIAFSTRRFVWWSRSVYSVLGAIRSTTTVPFAPADKLRWSVGEISALVARKLAFLTAPGKPWYVTLVCRPHHGKGYTTRNFKFV